MILPWKSTPEKVIIRIDTTLNHSFIIRRVVLRLNTLLGTQVAWLVFHQYDTEDLVSYFDFDLSFVDRLLDGFDCSWVNQSLYPTFWIS